jgi:predicted AlkP superfamily pyrophosphatase or phosphodiesterase
MFWDPQASIPRIRELASEGVASEGMRVCNPTVTWPNHTTLVTGVRAAKHSVLFNGVLVRPGAGLPVRIDEERDKAELVSGETIFDVLHEHGYRTAAIDWPCTRNSEALEDNFPDVPDHLAHTTPRLRRELLAEGVLTNETDAVFERLGGTQHDEIWTRAACLALERRKPHLLLLHLLNTDGVHHLYGPQTPPSYRALSLADGYVGQVLEALDRAGIRQNTTVFVTADHGFARAANVLQPNVLLRQKGLLEVGANNQIIKARAQAVPEGGTAMVYLTNPETRDGDRQKVLQLFSGKEGIAEIIQPERYEALGLPSPVKDPHMADLVLAAAEGYAFSGSATGEDFVVPVGPYTNRGYHGYLASDSKMDAALVIAGRGVRRGSKIGLVENVDIAPTIAQLLGQKLERADGKVLSEALLPY